MKPVMDPKPERNEPHRLARTLHRPRDVVKNFFGTLTRFPAVAARSAKTARNHVARVKKDGLSPSLAGLEPGACTSASTTTAASPDSDPSVEPVEKREVQFFSSSGKTRTDVVVL
jgi:hypothetical protein